MLEAGTRRWDHCGPKGMDILLLEAVCLISSDLWHQQGNVEYPVPLTGCFHSFKLFSLNPTDGFVEKSQYFSSF